MTPPVYRRAQDDGWLAVDCWCRTHTVSVPQQEVMATLTRSCGLPECDEWDRQHRKEAS